MTGMALAHCILGKFLGVVCHCFPPRLELMGGNKIRGNSDMDKLTICKLMINRHENICVGNSLNDTCYSWLREGVE